MPTPAEAAKAATIGEMATRANYEVMRAGRETVQKSATRWRRVTDGKPCGFCAMVASRGPVYHSAESAAGYHAHCGCTVEPYDGDPADWVPSADEQRYLEAYQESYRAGIDPRELSDLIEAKLSVPRPYDPNLHGLDALPRFTPSADLADEGAAVNPHFLQGEEWARNCQSSTATYELRARGFDVEAVMRVDDGSNPAFLPMDKSGVIWRRPDGRPAPWSRAGWPERFLYDLEKWPPGARGQVAVQWRGGGPGHVFNVERTPTGLRFLDGQDPTVSPDMAVSHSTWMDEVDWNFAYYMRLDDLEPGPLLGHLVQPRGTGATQVRPARTTAPEVVDPDEGMAFLQHLLSLRGGGG